MHPTGRSRLTNQPVRFPQMILRTLAPVRALSVVYALFFAIVFFLAAVPGLRAQDGVVNTPPPASENPQDDQAPEKSDSVIKSSVNVVQVFFNVKDKHG